MKRILALFVALLIVSVSAVSASALTVIQDGDWLLERETDADAYSVYKYTGSDADLNMIESLAQMPVLRVQDNAFNSNVDLVSIDCGSVLVEIGENAFSGCTSLSEVDLPATLNSIGGAAFANTSALSTIDLEDTGITEVPGACFSCSGIGEIVLPDSCVSIGYKAFQRCASLVKIYIPASVTAIDETAFEDCDGLTIYTVLGSYAVEYADENSIRCIVSYLRGDTDGDGTVSILDATIGQRLLVGLEEDPDGIIAMRGDCDGDGLNILDATKIQRWLAAFPVSESIGEIVEIEL